MPDIVRKIDAVNLAVIGLGKMGLSHLAIANALDQFNVKYLVEKGRLARRLLKAGEIEVCESPEKAISDSEVNALIIATPTHTHYEIAKSALNAGKHVFLEKPMTTGPQHSDELVKLSIEKNQVLQIGYVNRFNPVFQFAKSLVDRGSIGEIKHVISSMRGGVVVETPGKGWRNDSSKGGGALLDYGSHAIDILLMFMGPEVNLEFSQMHSIYSQDAEDVANLWIRGNSDSVGIVSVNWSDVSKRKAENEVEVQGSGGKLVASKQEVRVFALEKHTATSISQGWNRFSIADIDTSTEYYLRGEEFTSQLVTFAESIRSGSVNWHSSLKQSCLVDSLMNEAKNRAKK